MTQTLLRLPEIVIETSQLGTIHVSVSPLIRGTERRGEASRRQAAGGVQADDRRCDAAA